MVDGSGVEPLNHSATVYDHDIVGERAWFRFTLKWTDASTGETRTRAVCRSPGLSETRYRKTG
jgi:hypothetical protein